MYFFFLPSLQFPLSKYVVNCCDLSVCVCVCVCVLFFPQEMVMDKTPNGIRPRFLIYDVMQFEVSYLRV